MATCEEKFKELWESREKAYKESWDARDAQVKELDVQFQAQWDAREKAWTAQWDAREKAWKEVWRELESLQAREKAMKAQQKGWAAETLAHWDAREKEVLAREEVWKAREREWKEESSTYLQAGWALHCLAATCRLSASVQGALEMLHAFCKYGAGRNRNSALYHDGLKRVTYSYIKKNQWFTYECVSFGPGPLVYI